MFGVLLHCSDITMMQKILLVGISWRGGELEWWGVRGRALFEEMDYVEVAPPSSSHRSYYTLRALFLTEC